jgi:hypothetical protein
VFKTLLRHLTPARRQNTSSPRPRANRLGVEALETRLAPSASPFIYSTLDDTARAPGHTTATAQAVSLSPMMESRVVASRYWGTNLSDSTHDVYKVQLHKGQIFTAYDIATPGTGMPVVNQLSLLDGSGKALTSSAGSVYNPGFAYRVQQDGTYYVAIDLQEFRIVPYYVPAVTNYEVDLRPVGLNPAMQDPTWLQKGGGEMDVWLDGKTLDVSGPAGHGFGITGNWTQTVHQSKSLSYSTYTATGIIAIQGAGGVVNVGLPNGTALTITTQPSQWGALFGPVDSLVGAGSFSLTALAATLGKNGPLGLQLTGTSSTLPNQHWGIGLGGAIKNPGVPLNAAVPYLYFVSSDDASATFGGVQVQADHVGHGFSMVDDPADPFLYVGIKGVPLIKNFGVGWSTHALIRFAPGSAPANYHGSLSGNFYHVGEVDLSDVDIPIVIDGDWTVNFDPNHTGKVFGGATITASDILGVLSGKKAPTSAFLKQLDTAFKNVSFEHNGTLSLNLSEDDVGGVQIPVVQDTDVYDGAAQTLYMHVNSANPFKGTFLADYVKGDVSLDGTFNRASGQWDLIAQCDLDVFGQETVGNLELNNQGVKFDSFIHSLGTNVELTGHIYTNGDASLKGDATVGLFLANVTGHFDLERHGGATTLTVSADLSTLGTTVDLVGTVSPDGDYTLTGKADTNFYVGWGEGTFTLTHAGNSTNLHVQADVGVAGQDAQFSGDINSDGTYTLKADIDSGFYLVGGEAHFTLANDGHGTTCQVNAFLTVLGDRLEFQGQVDTSGYFSITNSGDFYIPGPTDVGNIAYSVTLTDNHGQVALSGSLAGYTPTLYIPVPVLPAPLPVHASGNVWFSVTADAHGVASYALTSTVTGQFWTPFGWQNFVKLDLGVANDVLAFTAHDVFGTQTFTIGLAH